MDTRCTAAARSFSELLHSVVGEAQLIGTVGSAQGTSAGFSCAIGEGPAVPTPQDGRHSFVVLVARPGISVSAVQKRFAALSDLGDPPQWGIFATRRAASRRAGRRPATGPSEPAIPQAETRNHRAR